MINRCQAACDVPGDNRALCRRHLDVKQMTVSGHGADDKSLIPATGSRAINAAGAAFLCRLQSPGSGCGRPAIPAKASPIWGPWQPENFILIKFPLPAADQWGDKWQSNFSVSGNGRRFLFLLQSREEWAIMNTQNPWEWAEREAVLAQAIALISTGVLCSYRQHIPTAGRRVTSIR